MKKLILISTLAWLAIACSSPAGSGSNSTAAKTNVNTVDKIPYSQIENTYTFTTFNSEVGPLKEFVGKTASEIKLWQNRGVVRRLRKLMGADFETMRKFWNTETPLEKFGDYLMLTGCERDNCVNNQYVIFLSTSEGLIGVVHINKERIREWKTRGTLDLPLPQPFADELSAMKSRRKEENGN